MSFHLLIEDQGLVLSAILVPFGLNRFMLCPWAMSFFQKLCPAALPPVTRWVPDSSPEAYSQVVSPGGCMGLGRTLDFMLGERPSSLGGSP